ncbi:MAG: acylphosphatase [Bryobacterales bacterium]|nr:acylphosphatase [Bryobacterales bacterium]
MRIARHFYVRGRVQGVGYRYFAQREATALGVVGYARNLDDGRVEVYAVGDEAQVNDLLARLHQGPRFSDVRGVESIEAPVLKYEGFRILA